MSALAARGDGVHVRGLAPLQDRGGMRWTERKRGWLAMPDKVLNALTRDGFEECKRMMTTSRHDLRPSGGVWQGVNRTTGSVASAIWVARAARRALVFIEIDGEPIRAESAVPGRSRDRSHRQGGHS